MLPQNRNIFWNVQSNTTDSVHVTNVNRPIPETAYPDQSFFWSMQQPPHTCVTLTEVSPDRCHSLAFGKTVHSQATVPVTAAEQELGII